MHAPDQVLTAAEMRAAEQSLVDRGVSIDELMDRAGRGAADWAWRVAMGRPVTVLCGPGNNGGDGYVIAEALRERGLDVTVVAPLPPATDAGRAASERWQGPRSTEPSGKRGGVFVDCLFGSGLSRPLSDDYASLLERLARSHDVTVALDMPSGAATDDGSLLGPVPGFDLTLALGAWKPAHFLMPAVGHMGQLRCIDIGIEDVGGVATLYPRPALIKPTRDAHKYSRGLAGIVAGTMPGAAMLAAQAALRGGAGYVKLLTADDTSKPADLVLDRRPLTEALTDERLSALLVGPGLGRNEAARERLLTVLERGLPTVLDADALHMLDYDALEGVEASRILITPHEGELAALCRTFEIGVQDKLAQTSLLSQATGVTVLAKGPDTILATATGKVALFPPASSWLSTAGTGDVLAGLTTSRLAAGRDPFDAAGEAVWIHGEAAQRAGPAFTAHELSLGISKAYAQFL